MAKLWSSETSQRGYGARVSDLYKAIAKAGPGKLVMVRCENERSLAHAERCYIRLLAPSLTWPGSVERMPCYVR